MGPIDSFMHYMRTASYIDKGAVLGQGAGIVIGTAGTASVFEKYFPSLGPSAFLFQGYEAEFALGGIAIWAVSTLVARRNRPRFSDEGLEKLERLKKRHKLGSLADVVDNAVEMYDRLGDAHEKGRVVTITETGYKTYASLQSKLGLQNWFDVLFNALSSYTFLAKHYKPGDEVTTYIGNSEPLVTTGLFKPTATEPGKLTEKPTIELAEASNVIDATHIFRGRKKDE